MGLLDKILGYPKIRWGRISGMGVAEIRPIEPVVAKGGALSRVSRPKTLFRAEPPSARGLSRFTE